MYAMTHQDWDPHGKSAMSAMFTIDRMETARMKNS